MNICKWLKEIIKKIENHRFLGEDYFNIHRDCENNLEVIKQAIEAVNKIKMYNKFGCKVAYYDTVGEFLDWIEVKKLLDIK